MRTSACVANRAQDRFDVSRFGTRRHPHRDSSDHELNGAITNVGSCLAPLPGSHRHHRHKRLRPIRRQSEATLARSPDPVATGHDLCAH
jgi:hypothetical protein